MPGSSVRTRAPLTVPQLEMGMNISRKQLDAETQRQTMRVSEPEESQIAREEREAADDEKLQRWSTAYLTHLGNYTTAAAKEYTQGHLSEAFMDFGKKLKVRYSQMDDWEKAYLLAESRKQMKTADEIFEYIQEQRAAASVSSLPNADDPVQIVLTSRQKSYQRFRPVDHLVPQKRQLSSRHQIPPRHPSPRDQR